MIGYFRLIEILDGPDVCMLRYDCLIAIDRKGKTRCEKLARISDGGVCNMKIEETNVVIR